MILIKNGRVHDGKGKVEVMDVLIQDGIISKLEKNISCDEAEIIDASNMEVFPGFIDTVSDWGVLGPGMEIRGNAKDNDEKSDVFTPELDVIWAVNGRGMERQQIPAWGITSVGVAPSNSNVFGGKIAAFQTVGINPMKMILKEFVGMKASVTSDVKMIYGSRNQAPMTKMGIFSMIKTKLKEAKEYDPSKEGCKRDEKLAALKEMLDKKIPLFVACNNPAEIEQVLHATEDYDFPLVFINGYGINQPIQKLIDRKASIIVTDHSDGMNQNNRTTDFNALMEMAKQGVNISFCASGRGFGGRENLLWAALEMYKATHDEEAVLSMLTYNAAKTLGIDQLTGSIEVNKRADIVLWSANPITTFKGAVEKTFVKGELVYKKGDKMKCFL